MAAHMDDAENRLQAACSLKKSCYSCRKCILHEHPEYDPHVFAVGNVAADVFFVGEAPGADEVRLKKPLVGKSGRIFNEVVLGGLGLKREQAWITNTVLCRPPNNRRPEKEEIEACSSHLACQFELIKPKLAVALGPCRWRHLLELNRASHAWLERSSFQRNTGLPFS